MDMKKSINRLNWAHLLPIFHLFACLVFSVGYIVPRLQYFAVGWVLLNFADFPISIVALAIGGHHQALGWLFYVVVGTSWWYLLGSKADKYLKRRRTSEG
ncbi:MAG: hypothetical protein WB562_02685 [Candidatus Sulfotelmatobacter sp.]